MASSQRWCFPTYIETTQCPNAGRIPAAEQNSLVRASSWCTTVCNHVHLETSVWVFNIPWQLACIPPVNPKFTATKPTFATSSKVPTAETLVARQAFCCNHQNMQHTHVHFASLNSCSSALSLLNPKSLGLLESSYSDLNILLHPLPPKSKLNLISSLIWSSFYAGITRCRYLIRTQ